MHSLPLVGLILLGLIFLWLNYSEYIVVEGARNRYKKSVSIASEIQQIQGNLKNNNKKIKEFPSVFFDFVSKYIMSIYK